LVETSMAEIVLMNAWRASKRRRERADRIQIGQMPAGEVVLFTGVRYERYDCFDDRMDRKAENHAVHYE
jgi:hypothetical protein